MCLDCRICIQAKHERHIPLLSSRRRRVPVLCVNCGRLRVSAQTDVAASFYGAFTGTTEGNGTIQSPSNSAGGFLELRHISNPLIGYELNYSFNRANQSYNLTSVKATANEVGANWVVSVPVLMFRPFVVAGGGLHLLPSRCGSARHIE